MTDASQYLLVVYRATREGSGPVSPGRVADALGKSPPTVTETLQRLDSRGLLDYEPYQGVTLTDEGRAAATELYDTYSVLVRFFREVLDLEDPEAEALAVADALDPDIADRLASTLLSGADAEDRLPASPSADSSHG